MNKKIVNQIGISILIMIILSIILTVTDIVPGKYLDSIITLSGGIIGLIFFIIIRREKSRYK
jgi:glycopeptide antibiotics resistance protein